LFFLHSFFLPLLTLGIVVSSKQEFWGVAGGIRTELPPVDPPTLQRTWRSSAGILLDIRSRIDRCNLGALPDGRLVGRQGSALCGRTLWG
jgi:hypothetical protein